MDVLVIGGGVAGLTAGVALADRGLRVTLLERQAHLGGRAASWSENGDVIDIGPHVLLSEYRNFPRLLERLGTLRHVVWQPRTVMTLGLSTGPYALRHAPLPTPFSLVPSFLGAPGLAMRDLASNMRPTWRALRFHDGDAESVALEQVTGKEWLDRLGVTPRMQDWFWKLASMAVCNLPLEEVSAASLLRMHAMIIGHRRVHFGFAGVGLGELFAPAARAVIEAAGGRVHTGVAVKRWNDVPARRTIVAVPPQELEALGVPGVETGAFRPSPYISAYLWFDRSITRERFWALPWTPTRLFYDFYDLANIRGDLAGRGSLIACNLIDSTRATGMSDAEAIAAALREIAEFTPAVRDASLVKAAVHRIPMAIPRPACGVEAKRPKTRTALPGVYLAGDWTDTRLPCSMESAACSGYQAAEAVLADAGRPESLALPMRPMDGLARVFNGA